MANAYTQLADVIVPSLFAGYVAEQSVVQNKLISSGFITVNPALSAFLAGEGFVQTFPSFLHTDVSDTDALVPSDDASVTAEAEKVTAHAQVVIKMKRNKVWQAASLTAQMIGADPLQAAAAMAGTAMNKIRQGCLIKVLAGTLNETVSAALVNTIAAEATGSVTAATSLTASTVIDTLGAWGDNASTDGVALVIHSDQHRVLQKANLISYVPTNAQDIGFGTYLGMTLVVDDTCPKRAGTTSGNVYTSYLIRRGGIGFGMATSPDAVELYRAPLAGNSGGIDSLIVRDTFTYHVNGYAWAGATDALPTNTALGTAANWTKKFATKQVGALALIHN
jgi:hypothetical protein